MRTSNGPAVVVSRNELMRLPFDVKGVLSDVPRHVQALHILVQATDEDAYVRAAAEPGGGSLAHVLYPVERAVDVLDHDVCELAAIAVRETGLPAGEADENLAWLQSLGVTTPARTRSLRTVHVVRGGLGHTMEPDDHRALIRAAALLDREIVPFVRDYTTWFVAQRSRER